LKNVIEKCKGGNMIAIIKIIHPDAIHLMNLANDAANDIRAMDGYHEVEVHLVEDEEKEMP